LKHVAAEFLVERLRSYAYDVSETALALIGNWVASLAVQQFQGSKPQRSMFQHANFHCGMPSKHTQHCHSSCNDCQLQSQQWLSRTAGTSSSLMPNL
jgi:hypothetical protein